MGRRSQCTRTQRMEPGSTVIYTTSMASMWWVHFTVANWITLLTKRMITIAVRMCYFRATFFSSLSISLLSTANGHSERVDPEVRRSWATICPDQGLLRWVSAPWWAIFGLYFLVCSNADVASHFKQVTFTGYRLLCLHLALARPSNTFSFVRLSYESTWGPWLCYSTKWSMMIDPGACFIQTMLKYFLQTLS